jgi:hypothetical protein
LIPKFTREYAAKAANFGIGTLAADAMRWPSFALNGL